VMRAAMAELYGLGAADRSDLSSPFTDPEPTTTES